MRARAGPSFRRSASVQPLRGGRPFRAGAGAKAPACTRLLLRHGFGRSLRRCESKRQGHLTQADLVGAVACRVASTSSPPTALRWRPLPEHAMLPFVSCRGASGSTHVPSVVRHRIEMARAQNLVELVAFPWEERHAVHGSAACHARRAAESWAVMARRGPCKIPMDRDRPDASNRCGGHRCGAGRVSSCSR